MKSKIMTFEEFKNDFAKGYAYPNWHELQKAYAERLNDPYEYIRKVNSVSVRYVAYFINKHQDLSFQKRTVCSVLRLVVGVIIGVLISKYIL